MIEVSKIAFITIVSMTTVGTTLAADRELQLTVIDRKDNVIELRNAKNQVYEHAGYTDAAWNTIPGVELQLGGSTVLISWTKIYRLKVSERSNKEHPGWNDCVVTVEFEDGRTKELVEAVRRNRITGESELGECHIDLQDLKEVTRKGAKPPRAKP